MKQYKNLLVSGCSFSTDGLGGVPPTITHPGGCSFIKDPDFPAANPQTWPGFLAQQMNITSLCNVATISQGNMFVANTILECLNRFNYKSDDTLVVMNLSDPSRLDIPCPYDHSDVNDHVPWNQDIIPYSYIKPNTELVDNIKQHMRIEQVEYLTTNQVEFLFTLLEYRNIDFYFLLMNDYTDACLSQVISKFKKHFIELIPGPSMYQYCQITKTYRSKKDGHPSVDGHKQIADIVYQHIFSN